MSREYFDVLIVGAGLSGIGSAWHLQNSCPDKSFLILESRTALGGTWDLFRYPGIRSDSDMFTLGYAFKPWRGAKAIADGPSILKYLRETAAENGIDRHIRYRHKVVSANWSSEEARWTVEAENQTTGESLALTCGFLLVCSGYYDYERGHLPDFEGIGDFQGQVIHPQFWPQDLDYSGKRIVVIGSGATAVTLVPELARDARSVTMLQRSPTYMVAMPDEDRIVNLTRKLLPESWTYAFARWKNIRLQQFIYRQTRKAPERVRKKLLRMARRHLGPESEFEPHFVPEYDPWDQRLCLVSNGDFFRTVRKGRATVVTDTIDRFTGDGIRLASGEELKADIVVTATGLDLCVLGDIRISVNGDPVNISECWSYKSLMLSGVPNMIATFGYINASWTLKADLTAEFACRLINHMDRTGAASCTPMLRKQDRDMPARDWIRDFSSGYIRRKIHLLPKQGDRPPWINTQSYFADLELIRKNPIDDGVLRFADATPNSSRDAA